MDDLPSPSERLRHLEDLTVGDIYQLQMQDHVSSRLGINMNRSIDAQALQGRPPLGINLSGWQDMAKGAFRVQMICEIIQYGHTLGLDIQKDQILLQYREQTNENRLVIDIGTIIADNMIPSAELFAAVGDTRWKFIRSVVDQLVAPTEMMSKSEIIERREEAIKMRYPLIWVGNGPLLQGCCM